MPGSGVGGWDQPPRGVGAGEKQIPGWEELAAPSQGKTAARGAAPRSAATEPCQVAASAGLTAVICEVGSGEAASEVPPGSEDPGAVGLAAGCVRSWGPGREGA